MSLDSKPTMDYVAWLKKEIELANASKAKAKDSVSDKDLLKKTRAEVRLSQSEFARMLGISTKALQGWELGKPVPKAIMILAGLIMDFPVVRGRLVQLAFEKSRPGNT